MNIQNESRAVREYAKAVTAAFAKLDAIKAAILAAGDCREKSWPHVGSMAEVNARLNQCGDFIGLDLTNVVE